MGLFTGRGGGGVLMERILRLKKWLSYIFVIVERSFKKKTQISPTFDK